VTVIVICVSFSTGTCCGLGGGGYCGNDSLTISCSLLPILVTYLFSTVYIFDSAHMCVLCRLDESVVIW